MVDLGLCSCSLNCLAACLRPLLSMIFNIHVHGFLASLFAGVVLWGGFVLFFTLHLFPSNW